MLIAPQKYREVGGLRGAVVLQNLLWVWKLLHTCVLVHMQTHSVTGLTAKLSRLWLSAAKVDEKGLPLYGGGEGRGGVCMV